MSVTTAMLTLLLLCFAPSLAPVSAPESFPLLQEQEQEPLGEPSLQWNGETEDAYRRALHLWKVRGKPAEAAEILILLADSSEVTQLAGQASWVLVLAAQCLAEAGLGDEASALIPGIERGAKRTELEPYVARELKAHAGLAGVQDPSLDRAFLNSVVEVFQGTDGAVIQGFVGQFNRALLPYLFEALDLWNSGSAPKNVGVFSFRYALTYLDQKSVPRLIQFSEELSDMSFLSLVHDTGSYWDDEARRAAWKFWEHLAGSEDPEHADRGRRGLARLAKSHYELVRESFEARLAAGDRELEAVWLSSIKGERNPAYAEIFRRAYALGGEGRWSALGHFASSGASADLLAFAVDGDEVAACLALALAVAADLGSVYTDEVGRYPSGSINLLNQEVTDLTGRSWGLGVRSLSELRGDPSDPRWATALGMLERQVQRDAPSGRLFLVLAALVLEDEAILNRSLEKLSPEAQVVLISMFGQRRPSHPFPYEVTWEWTIDGVQFSNRNDTENRFAAILSEHVESASWEPLRRRIDLLKASNRVRDLARNLRALGRNEDLLRLIADETIPAEAWLELIVLFGNSERMGSAPEILPLLANRLRNGTLSLSTATARPYVDDYYVALIEQISTPLSHVDQTQLHVLLEASFSGNTSNHLVRYVAKSDDDVSSKARQSFCSDALRAKYLLSALGNDAPEDLVLTSLRLGVSAKECFKQGAPSPDRFTIGSDARVELLRLLLRSSFSQDVMLGLRLSMQDLHAYQALKDEFPPLWSNPEFAASVANYVGVHRDADPAIIPLMLAVWQLPNLQDRPTLVTALGNTVDRRIVPVLMEAISDADQQVAAAAREGLQRLREIEEQRAFWESWQATGVGGSPETALLKQLRSDNHEVRLAAIQALGAMKSTNALPLLISLLEDADPRVVAAARRALAWISEAPGPAEPPK